MNFKKLHHGKQSKVENTQMSMTELSLQKIEKVPVILARPMC
jgi:hypothetical protein